MLSSRHVSEMLLPGSTRKRRDQPDVAKRLRAAVVGPVERLEQRITMSAATSDETLVTIESEPLTLQPLAPEIALDPVQTVATQQVLVARDDHFELSEDGTLPS